MIDLLSNIFSLMALCVCVYMVCMTVICVFSIHHGEDVPDVWPMVEININRGAKNGKTKPDNRHV